MFNRTLAGVGLVAAIVHLALPVAAPGWLALATKPLPVLCLLGWVATSGRDRATPWIAGGLALSAVGDLLLALEGRFLAGLVAFLAAHLAYVVGFCLRRPALAPLRALPFVAFGLGMALFLRPGLGEMAAPVLVYIAAITAMMWRASALVGAPGLARGAGGAALAGAIAFAASDSLLALDRFHAPIAGVVLPILVLYWLGQLGIAASQAVWPATEH